MGTLTIPTRPGQSSTGWTWADYVELPTCHDGQQLELIEGTLRMNAFPVPVHQLVVQALYRQLHVRIADSGRGLVFVSAVGVRLGDSEVGPDLVVLLHPLAGRLTPKRIVGAPDLVVEVLSEDRARDAVLKRAFYERNAVPEYWLVDIDAQAVTILALRDGVYSEQSSSTTTGASLKEIVAWVTEAAPPA